MISTELLVLLVSLIGVHIAGIAASRRGRQDYVLAGRSLSMPLLVATLVATWYGAILASGEFVLRYGIVFILCFGVPYYAVAFIYSTWLSGRVRTQMSASIPEQIGRVYGDNARRIAATLLLVITVPASYQLMLGHLISNQLGWSLGPSIMIGTIASISYVVIGGLRSDVYANVVQVILMYTGMGLLVGASIMSFGGPETLYDETTRPLFSVPGELGWGGILSWFVIATQTFIDPNFYVRAASASSASTARRAILWSVVCWIVFDLLQLVGGLYAARYLPGVDPKSAYLVLSGEVLPPWGRGIVIAGIVAAISSTLSGYALASATIIAENVIPVSRRAPHGSVLRNRIGLMIASLAGALVAINAPSFIELIMNAASIVVSALLLPTLLSHTSVAERFRASIIVMMIVPAGAALLSIIFVAGHPALVGLTTSFALLLFFWLKEARRS